MKQFLKLRHALLLLMMLGISSNIYLFYEFNKANTDLTETQQNIIQTSSLIKSANKKEDHPDKIMQRINQPTSRISIGQELSKLNHRLNIQQLAFKITPEETLTNDKETTNLTKSTVTLNMTSQSDKPVYFLIDHLLENFPGIIVPQQILLQRELSHASPLLKSSFVFEWVKKVTL